MSMRCALGGCALAAILAALSACEDAPRVSATHHVDDPWSFAAGVMKDGPMQVVVRGQPFDDDARRTEDAVLAALTGAVSRTATARFTTDPAQAASARLRIVVLFNDGGPGGREACAADAEGGAPRTGGGVRVVAAFCEGGAALATVQGAVERAAGIADAPFRALLRQAAIALFDSDAHP